MSPFSELSSHFIFLSYGAYSFITLIIVLCVLVLSYLLYETIKQSLESRKYVLYLMHLHRTLPMVAVQSMLVKQTDQWTGDAWMNEWMNEWVLHIYKYWVFTDWICTCRLYSPWFIILGYLLDMFSFIFLLYEHNGKWLFLIRRNEVA